MEARPRRILKYETEGGRCPFDEWLDGLKDKRTQATISNRLIRVAQGNFGLCRKLEGGDKSTQSKDIEKAREYWADYLKE